MASRQERALAERLLLDPSPQSFLVTDAGITALVIGSTGVTYTVMISEITTCTCMDFQTRNRPCKHIFFVLARVLRMPEKTWRRGTDFDKAELDNIFAAALLVATTAGPQPQSRRKPYENGEECPICLEAFQPAKESIIYCEKQCGHNFHRACINRCIAKICPCCRVAL